MTELRTIIDIELTCLAEKDIANRLRDLELATGSVIDNIKITNIEVTKLDSSREEWERVVRITLKRNPGTHWGQADE